MKRNLAVVGIVVASLAAGAWTLAAPDPYPPIKCSRYTCTSPGVCVTPYPGSGLCTTGKNGPGFPSDIGCCCCTEEDARNRWFHGE